jgi:hypothetical protein
VCARALTHRCGPGKKCTTHSDCKTSDIVVGGPIAGRGSRELACISGVCTADQTYDAFTLGLVTSNVPLKTTSEAALIIGDGMKPTKGECAATLSVCSVVSVP